MTVMILSQGFLKGLHCIINFYMIIILIYIKFKTKYETIDFYNFINF